MIFRFASRKNHCAWAFEQTSRGYQEEFKRKDSVLSMIYSAEVRWFLPEALSSSMLDWFHGLLTQKLEPEVRRDEYLVFPHCQSVGVKLRAGRKFEIKALASPPQRLIVNTEVSGLIDQWTKWSLDSQGLKALEFDLHQSGQWVGVSKRRYLREFSADAGQAVEITSDPTIIPLLGCNVELTVVEVGTRSSPWLTLGFEAFGPHASLSQTLEQTVQTFFDHQKSPPIPLTEACSMSYPAWLAKFSAVLGLE